MTPEKIKELSIGIARYGGLPPSKWPVSLREEFTRAKEIGVLV